MFELLAIRKAQTFAIRLTVHHKPHIYTGNLRLVRADPIICVLLFSRGGDCETIELLCLADLSECEGKVTQNNRETGVEWIKIAKTGGILC